MTPEEAQQIAVASLLTSGLSLVIGLGVYVWYAIMLAKVLAQFGRPGWAAWIPVYNEMQVFRIGGQQPWLALLLYVPLVQIVGLVFKVFALHRISTQSWRGVGTTILGVLLPPVWATVLAVGPSPDPERGRMPRGPVSGAIPPVQPNGPLAAPHPGAAEPVAPFGAPPAGPPAPAAPGSAPLPVWLVPGAPVPPAPPQGAPLPFDPPQGAPFEPAPAPQHPAPAAAVAPAAPVPAEPASSPFAPPSAFAAAEPSRAPGRIEPLPPMPGSAPAPAAPQGQPPQPEPPSYAPAATGTGPFAAPPAQVANPYAAPAAPPAAQAGAQAVASPLDAFEVDDAATIVTGDEDPFDRTVVVERRPAFPWRLLLPDGTALQLEGASTLLGRNPRSGDGGARPMVVPDPSRTLSKTHALIRYDGGQWWITDLDSTNGVLLADAAGTDQLIDVGVPAPFSDRFVLGTLEIRVAADPQAGAAYR